MEYINKLNKNGTDYPFYDSRISELTSSDQGKVVVVNSSSDAFTLSSLTTDTVATKDYVDSKIDAAIAASY